MIPSGNFWNSIAPPYLWLTKYKLKIYMLRALKKKLSFFFPFFLSIVQCSFYTQDLRFIYKSTMCNEFSILGSEKTIWNRVCAWVSRSQQLVLIRKTSATLLWIFTAKLLYFQIHDASLNKLPTSGFPKDLWIFLSYGIPNQKGKITNPKKRSPN